MEWPQSKPRPVQHPSQLRAFRTYISARRNYSITGVDTQTGMSPPTIGTYITGVDTQTGMSPPTNRYIYNWCRYPDWNVSTYK